MSFRVLHPGAALAIAGLLLAVDARPQTHRATKLEKVTRAIGVYEWTGELAKPTASRLVPVSLFIDGHLQDAGVYLARPVPFALNPGYLYSVEQAGEPVGTLDLDEARNLVSNPTVQQDNSIAAWYGYGHFTAAAAPAKPAVLKTSAHPGVIVASNADGRPHFSTRSSAASPAAGSATGSTTADTTPGAGTADKPAAATPPTADRDPDRPHMSRRSETTTEATDKAPAASTPTTSTREDGQDDPERPTLRRRDTKSDPKRRKESGSGVTPMTKSLNDDPDRPSLSRNNTSVPLATPPLNGNPPDLHQAIAVSDPNVVDNHPFARAWESAAERAYVLAAFRTLARPRVANYLALNQLKPGSALSTIPATSLSTPKPGASPVQPAATDEAPAPPRLQRGRPSDLPAEKQAPAPAPHASPVKRPTPKARTRRSPTVAEEPLQLQAEQLTGFTLSYGGLPTFVYSAATPVSEGLPVHITLVAQQLPTGEFQVALSSVTDEAHLDRTPWMRLVDVVDANNSHRASFLFELRAKASRQFALYALASSQAEQSFVTGPFQ